MTKRINALTIDLRLMPDTCNANISKTELELRKSRLAHLTAASNCLAMAVMAIKAAG